jgi:hypothetical protein
MTRSSSSSSPSIKTKLLSLLLHLLPFSARIVFSRARYIALAIGIAVCFWIIFNVFEQLLFFSPIWVFYLPEDAVIGFVLTNVTAILVGTLVSMNVYVINYSKLKITKLSSLFSGASLSILSSMCVSCSSIGFLIISTFGGLGIVVSNFLSVHELSLRIISIGILLFALYSVHKRITKSCITDYNNTTTYNNKK